MDWKHYKEQGIYPTALENYLQALKIYEKLEDTLDKGNALLNISSIYRYLKQYEKAKKYALEAKELFTKSDDADGIGKSLYRLSLIHTEQNDFNTSTGYLVQVKKVFEKIEDKYWLALVNNLLGNNFLKKSNYNIALIYFESAFVAADEMNEKSLIASALGNIGIVYEKQKKYFKALEFANKSQKLLKDINDKQGLMDLSIQFINIYSRINKPDSVLKYFEAYQQLSDTIYSEQSSKAISEMQTKYETEKKEKENAKLKLENQAKEIDGMQQRNLKFIFLGATLISILIIYLIIRNNQTKTKANKLVQQNELFKLQNGIRQNISNDLHDEIGSGLTTISMICIQGISDDKKQIPIKSSLLDKISLQSRILSENMSELLWATNPEHDNLSSLFVNIRTYTYNFFENSNIKYQLNISDKVSSFSTNPETNRNIFLILKEGLNNISKHSFAEKVEINFFVDIDKNFTLEIKDNGQGFDIYKPSRGNGRNSLQKRVAAIESGKFELKSEIGLGTTLIVEGKLS